MEKNKAGRGGIPVDQPSCLDGSLPAKQVIFCPQFFLKFTLKSGYVARSYSVEWAYALSFIFNKIRVFPFVILVE